MLSFAMVVCMIYELFQFVNWDATEEFTVAMNKYNKWKKENPGERGVSPDIELGTIITMFFIMILGTIYVATMCYLIVKSPDLIVKGGAALMIIVGLIIGSLRKRLKKATRKRIALVDCITSVSVLGTMSWRLFG